MKKRLTLISIVLASTLAAPMAWADPLALISPTEAQLPDAKAVTTRAIASMLASALMSACNRGTPGMRVPTPDDMLSTATAVYPWPCKLATMWAPMYPAPPVTRQVMLPMLGEVNWLFSLLLAF